MSNQKHNGFGPKLAEDDVLTIVERCRNGETQKAVAGDYPVTRAMVSCIMSGQSWSEVTGIEPRKPGYAKGESSPSAKLTRDQVVEIVRRCKAGESFGSVAGDYPVGRGQVASILRGASWSHLTGIESGNGPLRGEHAPTAKLTEADVLEILERHEAGEAQIRIARDFPVNQSQISKIIRGRSWTCVTGLDLSSQRSGDES